jgi:predicted small lipoprotein YifL
MRLAGRPRWLVSAARLPAGRLPAAVTVQIAVLLTSLLGLAACGQMGPLSLPGDAEAAAAETVQAGASRSNGSSDSSDGSDSNGSNEADDER